MIYLDKASFEVGLEVLGRYRISRKLSLIPDQYEHYVQVLTQVLT